MDVSSHTSEGPTTPDISADPKDVGQWEMIEAKFAGSPTHVALLHTNQIYAYGGSSLEENRLSNPPPAELLDLSTMQVRKISMSVVGSYDVWCGGQTFLEDGRLLVAGGTSYYPKRLEMYGGLNKAFIYDPVGETWESPGDMQVGRWYPTLIRLPDNRVLVIAGFKDKFPELWVRLQEVFQLGEGWDVMKQKKLFPLYPRLHLLPNGNVYYSGVFNTHFFIPWAFPSAIWDRQTGVWTKLGGKHFDKSREEGISVLLALRPPDYKTEVLIAGGGDHNRNRILLDLLHNIGLEGIVMKYGHMAAVDSAERIDLSREKPAWEMDSQMRAPRIHAVGVLLPDGKMLSVGGMRGHNHYLTKEMFEDRNMAHVMGVLNAEMYDPDLHTWSWMAAQQRPRLYHSTALLLPDARVVSMGSNPYAGMVEPTIEIYSPPYLFKGDRPVIVEHPGEIHHAEEFRLRVDNARQIGQAVLMRPEALTHVTNTDQRLLELEFQVLSDDSVEVRGPLNVNHMPQGYGLLFVLNLDGVPSVGKFVRVG